MLSILKRTQLICKNNYSLLRFSTTLITINKNKLENNFSNNYKNINKINLYNIDNYKTSNNNSLIRLYHNSNNINKSKKVFFDEVFDTDKSSSILDDILYSTKYYQLLLRGAMIQKREIIIPKLFFNISKRLFNKTNNVISFRISNVAGHSAFILLSASYLENDFLNLRLYALSGVSLSIIFQYYREIPLWIPIRWNILFLLINMVMIAIIYKETNDANNVPEVSNFLFISFNKQFLLIRIYLFYLIIGTKRIIWKSISTS
jgi:hypothetical protein